MSFKVTKKYLINLLAEKGLILTTEQKKDINVLRELCNENGISIVPRGTIEDENPIEGEKPIDPIEDEKPIDPIEDENAALNSMVERMRAAKVNCLATMFIAACLKTEKPSPIINLCNMNNQYKNLKI